MPQAMAQIAQAVGGVSALYKTIKDAADVARDAKNLELYQRMMAVYGDVMEIVEKNRELVDENRSLHELLKNKEQLTFDGERYWLKKDGNKEGPFCSICQDIDSKLVRMRAYPATQGGTGYTCDYCSYHRSKR